MNPLVTYLQKTLHPTPVNYDTLMSPTKESNPSYLSTPDSTEDLPGTNPPISLIQITTGNIDGKGQLITTKNIEENMWYLEAATDQKRGISAQIIK